MRASFVCAFLVCLVDFCVASHTHAAQFCRSAKNLPSLEYQDRTAHFLREDFGVRVARGSARDVASSSSSSRKFAAKSSNATPTPAPTHTYADKPFGWYSCDTTPNMLDQILTQALGLSSSFDAILITGDFVAHNQLDENSTRAAFSAAYNAIDSANTNNLPVIATIGNEDFYRKKEELLHA